MSSRGKRKKTHVIESPGQDGELLLNLDIKTLTEKYIIEVILFAGKDEQSNNILENLKSISKRKKDVAYATIITYEDILKVLNNFEPIDLPEHLDRELKYILSDLQSVLKKVGTLTPMMVAQLFKIKLIEVIYKQNAVEKERTLRTKVLEEELNLLMKDCRSVNKLKVDVNKQISTKNGELGIITERAQGSRLNLLDATKKIKVKNELYEMQNETESVESLVFEDDISTRIWYYIFQGITDPKIINYLNNELNLKVTSIVEIDLKLDQQDQQVDNEMAPFWHEILEYLYGGNRQKHFENTMLMNYVSKGIDLEEIYDELIFVLRNLWKIKWWHLHYIRHTKIVPMKGRYPFIPTECFNIYNEILDCMPSELTTSSVICSSLLQEIQYRFGEQQLESSTLDFSETDYFTNSNPQNECPNPLILSNMVQPEGKDNVSISKSFMDNHLIYENNIFELTRKSYSKRVGKLALNYSLDVLKEIRPFYLVNNVEALTEITHKHDRAHMSPELQVDEEKMLHFMYIFLFSLFKNKNCIVTSNNTDGAEVTRNLNVYNKQDIWEKAKVVVKGSATFDLNSTENLYETPLSFYLWREKLSSDVLMQEILIAQEEYQYAEIKYCQENDTYLLLCSDQLDPFGLNVKVFDESLSTPVCLRDFCKYTTTLKSDFLSRNQPPLYTRTNTGYLGQALLNDEYDEYRQLLSSKLDLCDSEVNVTKGPTLSFQNFFKELQEYPMSDKLTKETSKLINEESVNVFDIGTQFVSVLGFTTTFVSHDGVKIVVDNTKFVDEQPKCTIRLNCNSNDIVLHSNSFYNENNYSFHVNLTDGALITFFVNDNAPNCENKVNNPVEVPSQISTDVAKTNLNELMDTLKKVVVISTEHNDLDCKTNVTQSNSVPTLDIGDVVRNLKNTKNSKFYKTHENFKMISPVNPKFKVPFINIVDRLIPINDVPMDKQQVFSKRLVSTTIHHSKQTPSAMDVRISLPNGLYLSCTPSPNTNEDLVEVKQEFLNTQNTEEAFEEEFRLFTREGFVLVKKIDGVISIYKCSGEQILFEKPNSVDENIASSNLKKCHCNNLTDYRKKLVRLMNGKNEDSDYFSSRRGNVRTKKGYVIDSNLLNMLRNSKIPFKKTTVVKFSGHKTCLEGNKITQKRAHYQTSENDFATQETYFERSDGFQALVDKTGKLLVKYADGTVITSSLCVEEELVDGYLYVSLDVSYEHPKYLTVSYKNNKSLTVELNNDVKLLRDKDHHFKLLIGSDIETNVDMKSIHFTKKCEYCQMSYKCHFNIHPLVTKTVELSDRFIYVKDTYDKTFSVDYAGNCQRNDQYVTRNTNNFGCNHVEHNVYKKLFVLDQNLTGDQLWSESMVDMEKSSETDCQIKEGMNFHNKKVLRIVKNHYESYAARFYNNSLENKVMLSKYKPQLEPEIVYSSYKVLQKTMDLDEIEVILEELKNFFDGKTNTSNSLKEAVENLYEGCKTLRRSKSQLLPPLSEVEVKEKCKCVTIRRNMRDKISVWRQQLHLYKDMIHIKKIPNYFDSQFCHRVEK